MNMDTTYFFVGIKGTGMSALALILNDKGCKVAGSDIEKYTFTQRGLEQAGIEIFPFDEKNIHPVKVKVIYMEPLYYDEYKGMKTVDIAEEVRRRIEKVIEKYTDES